MRHSTFSTLRVLVILVFAARCTGENDFPVLEGPYFGQRPPGITPAVFAPGVLSVEGQYEGGATFSANGRMFAYKRHYAPDPDREMIWISEVRDGRWVEPHLAPFNSEASSRDFGFARSGSAFYFTSRRPAFIDGQEARPSNIWRTEPTSTGWTEPELLEAPVNVVDTYSGYPSLTRDGKIYSHSERDDSRGDVDIYRAHQVNGRYVVENLVPPINTSHRDFDPCIAPDESYLIFASNRPGGVFEYDLFIAFRLGGDAWSEPRALGGVLGSGGLPNISADGRYFFYAAGDYSNTSTIQMYWVDTRVFEQFKPRP